MKADVTIATSFDGSDFGTVEYVNRLFRACLWNVSVPFEFVLYTGPEGDLPGRLDGLDPAVYVVQTGLPWWWCGMPFWSADPPGIETDARLFLDLDVVVVGSLDDLLAFPSDHVCSMDYPAGTKNPRYLRDANPGVTLIRGDAGKWVWEEYVSCGMPVWNPFDRTVVHSPCGYAAQGIINDLQREEGNAVDLFPANWCASYKLSGIRKSGELPADCRIVHFHGRPKQWEAGDDWIKEHWR
jgi:hypothetical protein